MSNVYNLYVYRMRRYAYQLPKNKALELARM